MRVIGKGYKALSKVSDGAPGPSGPPGVDGKPGPEGSPGPAGPVLDWIQEWNGTAVQVGNSKIITPKLFAGTLGLNNQPTGVAIGVNVFGTTGMYRNTSGIVGYKDGVKTYHLTTDGVLLVGFEDGYHMKFDGSAFSLRASSVSIGTSSVTTVEMVADRLNESQELITDNLNVSIGQSNQQVLDSVSQNYATKDIVGGLTSKVDAFFTSAEGQFDMTFKKITEVANSADRNLGDYKKEVEKYIRFKYEGLELGEEGSSFKTRLSNKKLAFLQDELEVAYISNNKMYITEAEIKDGLKMGQGGENGFFLWKQGPSGNLSLKWSEE